MTITVEALKDIEGTRLPGGELVIEPYENAILEHALRAPRDAEGFAHPMWFVVISLRCLGISVDELCELAHKADSDTLLFGTCRLDQQAPLSIGARYLANAVVIATGSRITRDGSRLDHLDVQVEIASEAGECAGTVTSTYLFKRGKEHAASE